MNIRRQGIGFLMSILDIVILNRKKGTPSDGSHNSTITKSAITRENLFIYLINKFMK